MFSYYLCNDNETIYRVEFLLKEKDRGYYLSLLENYLSELVFIGESEFKKLVEEKKIKKISSSSFSVEEGHIILEKPVVTDVTKIEDYLPFVVTIKKKKYSFLRSYTIFMLIKLLSDYLDKIDNPYLRKIEKLLGYSSYLDFNKVLSIFFDEEGNIIPERAYDYQSFLDLLQDLKGKITETYSRSALACFWQGDEAERALAESIASDSKINKQALKILNYKLPINEAK